LYQLEKRITFEGNEVYRETMQEIMFELQLKTDKFLKKLKEENKTTRFEY